MKSYKLYINGAWQNAQSSRTDAIINPTDESVVGQVQEGTTEDVQLALKAAHIAQGAWRKTPAIERARLLRNFTTKIREN
ncbi:MAG: aldehyde dehydrogenase family protein, partial [Bacteroidota bacterium]